VSGEHSPPPDAPSSGAAHSTPESSKTAAAAEVAASSEDIAAAEVAAASRTAGSTSDTEAREPPGGTGDQPRPGQQSWWRPQPFSRPLWYPVAGTAAVLALLAGGGMTLVTVSRGPQARPLAADCGLVTCGASLPPVVTGAAVPSTTTHGSAPAHRSHRAAQSRVLAPAVHSRLRPSALPGRPAHRRHPRPPGGPTPGAVSVTYTVDGTDPWHHDFRAHLTIVNHAAAPVAGWTVQVSLPGDQVDWVGYPGGWDPFADWQFSGGTLVLNAVSGGETLVPGATEVVPISARGGHTVPGDCQFNGAACRP
jgi:Cellulose binding domain